MLLVIKVRSSFNRTWTCDCYLSQLPRGFRKEVHGNEVTKQVKKLFMRWPFDFWLHVFPLKSSILENASEEHRYFYPTSSPPSTHNLLLTHLYSFFLLLIAIAMNTVVVSVFIGNRPTLCIVAIRTGPSALKMGKVK